METEVIKINRSSVDEKTLCELLDTDILILCFPLYVDSIPSHLLHVLKQIELCIKEEKRYPLVYSIVNCGFFEGIQNELVFEVLENWCLKSGMTWQGGLGIGGGEMLASMPDLPIDKGPKKIFGKNLIEFSDCIKNGEVYNTKNIDPAFPKSVYKAMVNIGFRMSVKKNGLKLKDLYRVPK